MSIWAIIKRNAARWAALPPDRQAASMFNHVPGQPTFNRPSLRETIERNAAKCRADMTAGRYVAELRSRDSIKEAERQHAEREGPNA